MFLHNVNFDVWSLGFKFKINVDFIINIVKRCYFPFIQQYGLLNHLIWVERQKY